MTEQTKASFLCLFIWLGFLLLSSLIFILSWIQADSCEKLLTFQKTNGILLSLEVRDDLFTAIPEVTYSYQVNGIKYTGTRYSYNDYQRYYVPTAWLRAYGKQIGRSIPIYYDPANPSSAVLDFLSKGAIRIELTKYRVLMIVSGVFVLICFYSLAKSLLSDRA